MDKIMKAIEKWMDKNKGQVAFIGSFVVFDEEFDIKDDRMVGFGDKETLGAMIEGLQDEVKKEKKDFINW